MASKPKTLVAAYDTIVDPDTFGPEEEEMELEGDDEEEEEASPETQKGKGRAHPQKKSAALAYPPKFQRSLKAGINKRKDQPFPRANQAPQWPDDAQYGMTDKVLKRARHNDSPEIDAPVALNAQENANKDKDPALQGNDSLNLLKALAERVDDESYYVAETRTPSHSAFSPLPELPFPVLSAGHSNVPGWVSGPVAKPAGVVAVTRASVAGPVFLPVASTLNAVASTSNAHAAAVTAPAKMVTEIHRTRHEPAASTSTAAAAEVAAEPKGTKEKSKEGIDELEKGREVGAQDVAGGREDEQEQEEEEAQRPMKKARAGGQSDSQERSFFFPGMGGNVFNFYFTTNSAPHS